MDVDDLHWMYDSNSLAISSCVSAYAEADATSGCEEASGRKPIAQATTLVLKRKQQRAANFQTQDRFILGLLAFLLIKSAY